MLRSPDEMETVSKQSQFDEHRERSPEYSRRKEPVPQAPDKPPDSLKAEKRIEIYNQGVISSIRETGISH